jgi:probable addiction module antidote protein
MKIETSPFDAADYLASEKSIAAYLEAMLEDGDPKMINVALGTVARARGMAELANEVGVTRTSMYKSLSAEGNPSAATLIKVIKALGFQLHITPVDGQAPTVG